MIPPPSGRGALEPREQYNLHAFRIVTQKRLISRKDAQNGEWRM